MPSNESYPQYVVTAVIVAHDGATWLPSVADALLEQTRAIERVVAVDTGSRDRAGSILASKFGNSAVFGMDRATGYGAAIARALSHRAANLPVPGAADRVEWIWLLHDDCEPAPDALEQLLRGATETKAAAVLGPKLRDWSNREVILEAGVSLDTAARRVTGVEPREVDQGQHDGDRDALAVSSAGMLVRRDVWEQVGGFDPGMTLFMDDVDFCWRVHAAGYRVRVITDAVCFHVQAASKHRRAISVGRRARMLDRRNGLLTLLGNLPFRQMVTAAAGNIAVSLLRTAFFLLAKRLSAALDEAGAAASVLLHPFRLISMRRERSRGRRAAYNRVKADLPAGQSFRRLMEFAASTVMKSAQTDTTGAHHASVDPTEDDSLLTDNGSLARRLLTSATLLTFIVLVGVALFAGRSLIGSGPLGGGSLVPAWGGASDLWRSYMQGFHPSGLGSAQAAPSYIAVIATLATIFLGKTWLAIDVILLGCVPLAGMSAMLAVRRVTTSAPIRMWAAITYALLPVAMGVVSAGRFGSAVVFVLLPLIALTAGRCVTQTGPLASRAAWAAGFLIAIGAAFVPLLWLFALVGCLIAAVVLRNTKRGLLRNLAIVAFTAPVLLLPWSITLISRPSRLLLEAGLPQPGSPAGGLSGKMLLLLNPGGPGLPPYWVTGGLVFAALIALFAGRRRSLVMAGWGVALSGLLLAVLVSHTVVNPPDSGPVVVWAGLPLALAAIGLLLAASVGADVALGQVLAGGKSLSSAGTSRAVGGALIGLVACSTPLIAAFYWLSTGVSGPVHPVTNQVVPELVAIADGADRQVRTLVLREDHGHISYLLLRGASPSLADPEFTPPPAAQRALAQVVAALTTSGGGLAVSQGQLLADFDIGYVLVQAPADQQLSSMLDDVNGLAPYSTTPHYSIWQLTTPPARVTVVEPNGTVEPIASNPIGVTGVPAPAAGGIVMLAEPTGGWSASVNGRSLTSVASPAGRWAQAFKLPPGGGQLSVGHTGLIHDVWLAVEALALLVVMGLALPGIHVADEAQRDDEPVKAPAGRQAQETASGRGTRSGASDLAPAGARSAGAAAGSRAAGTRATGSRTATASDADEPVASRSGVSGAGRAAAGAARRAGLAGAAGAAAARVSRSSGGRGRGKPSRGKPSRGRSGGTPRGRDRDRDTDRTARYELDRDALDRDLGDTELAGAGFADPGFADAGVADAGLAGFGQADTRLADRDQVGRDQDGRGRGGRRRGDRDFADLDAAAAGLDAAGRGRSGDRGAPAGLSESTGRSDLPVRGESSSSRDRTASYEAAWDRASSDPAGWPAVGQSSGDRYPADFSENSGGRHSAARSQAGPPQAGPRPDDRTFSQNSGPGSRAWPYTDDRRADDGSARGDAGRQSSQPDWPVPARPASGRSPSGAAPPAQWSSQSADALDDRSDHGLGGYDRNGSGRGGRHHSDDPYERGNRYGSDWDSPDRSLPDRSGRSRHGRPEPAHPSSGWSSDDPLGLGVRSDDRYANPGYELDRREPERHQTRQYEVDRYTGDPNYDGDRYDNASRGRRARHGAGRSDAQSSWPGGGGGDELEPLPPPMGPSQGGSGRADAWRPGATGRSEPAHPYDPDDWDGDGRGEYEGDSW